VSEAAQVEETPTPVEAPAEVAQPDSSSKVDHLEQVPESFNIFTEESPSPSEPSTESSEPGPPRKSKQFLENLRRDKEVRRQEIELKQRQAELDAREAQVKQFADIKQQLEGNPEEFLRSQGIDPMQYYRQWTERMIDEGASDTVESKMTSTQKELADLKQYIASKEKAAAKAKEDQVRGQAYTNLCGEIEKFATNSDGYEIIKETCTAADIANGMVAHFQKTGEELTLEEAFEKIETGLREREESFYGDPKVLEKLQRYNPEAFQKVKGPRATLSAKWKEQPTRKSPEDMTDDEIMDHWKGKLFT
jgi:gas vesicle protein